MKGRTKRAKTKTSRARRGIETSAAPLYSEPTECYDPFLLADDETWLAILDPAFCYYPESAESLAHLFLTLKQAIESGPEGVARASLALSDGIHMAYKYTEAHQKALMLYHLYLAGKLRVEDEPMQLLAAAIARANKD
jgi:hypothetical protein